MEALLNKDVEMKGKKTSNPNTILNNILMRNLRFFSALLSPLVMQGILPALPPHCTYEVKF